MNDTDPITAGRFLQMMKKKSNEERLLMGCSMYDTAKQIVKSSLCEQHPGASAIEMRKELFLRFYGQEFTNNEVGKILRVLSGERA